MQFSWMKWIDTKQCVIKQTVNNPRLWLIRAKGPLESHSKGLINNKYLLTSHQSLVHKHTQLQLNDLPQASAEYFNENLNYLWENQVNQSEYLAFLQLFYIRFPAWSFPYYCGWVKGRPSFSFAIAFWCLYLKKKHYYVSYFISYKKEGNLHGLFLNWGNNHEKGDTNIWTLFVFWKICEKKVPQYAGFQYCTLCTVPACIEWVLMIRSDYWLLMLKF